MYLAWEAVSLLAPDLYIGKNQRSSLTSLMDFSIVVDTMGYAFTFHVISTLCQIPIGAYIHYPTISTDMISRVKTRKSGHTNIDVISSSAVLSWGKLLYFPLSRWRNFDPDTASQILPNIYVLLCQLRQVCFLHHGQLFVDQKTHRRNTPVLRSSLGHHTPFTPIFPHPSLYNIKGPQNSTDCIPAM